jgi:pimeloyl-ACP methyl ester carboxylesterase
VLAFVRAARTEHLATRLARIRVPTLLVWGTEDRITPPAVARRFHALIPGSDLMMLARCGHMPMLERPEAFSAIAQVWLAGSRPRRARAEVVRGGAR